MQRTMLAAVQDTDKRLTAQRYRMKFMPTGHLAFSSLAQKDVHYGTNSMATSSYLMFISDIAVIKLTAGTQN